MKEQQERSREGGKFEAKGQMPAELASQLQPTAFLGYDALMSQGSKVVGIVRGGKQYDQLGEGEEALVMLDRTPFYAESGGQVGDTGVLVNTSGSFAVADTLKMGGVFFGHAGRWNGKQALRVGDVVEANVDGTRRQAIVLNHSATHLLHAALRKVLGEHVTQKGSLVAPERLRFDFSHFKPMSADELRQIEALVNAEVRRNEAAEVHQMGYNEAIEFGAMALFGEKYGDEVRVLKMGGFSTELCGGTHVGRTGDIGLFKIVSEAGVASGVRRIEAVTGAGALAYVADEERRLGEFAQLLSSSGDEAVEKLRQLFDKQKKLERELESLARQGCRFGHGRPGLHGEGGGRYQESSPPAWKGWTPRRCATAWTSSSSNWAIAWCCWRVRRTAVSPWSPVSAATRWVGSRPATWWLMSPARSMARAAVVPTWPRVAAPILPELPGILEGLADWISQRLAP